MFAEDNTVGYSIVEPFVDEKGVEYKNAVLLDTNFFEGISPRNWGRKLRKYVENRSKNNPFILPIIDESGNIQQLQFTGIKDRVKKEGHSEHKAIDKLWNNSDNAAKLAVIHVDEIITVSEEKNPYYTNEHTHQWLDENGWLHRTANEINARSGDIYELTIDIAKAKDGRIILYATNGKTKKVGNVQVNSLKLRGSGQNSDFEGSVTQADTDVNTKFSRQLLNGEWDDIRDKMYENEVHEDIIRTGSQVNDDMYREYEEFSKMTREETVYVSQQVYDHYVEEYSTRKNLNRACAGKIKIKYYENNNRTGRGIK